MSKRKQKKTSLKSAILLLLLMALLLITSSYAWFTANQTVTVSTLQVNVKASNGLQISADAQNWKTILEKTDLTQAAADYSSVIINQLPDKNLEPVSSAGVVTNGKMEMFYGVVAADNTKGGEYYLSATKQTDVSGTDGKYIAFDLFLRVDQPTTIYMTKTSNVTFEGDDKGLKNAARVAFVTEGNTAGDTDPATMRALSLASGTADIWEPNYDVHTALGVAAARDYYQVTTDKTNGSLIPYYGIKADIPASTIPMKQVTTANPSATYFAAITPKFKTLADNQASPEFMQLAAGVTKIRVYMWVEGQDVDCENGASGSSINFDLGFTAVAPTVP